MKITANKLRLQYSETGQAEIILTLINKPPKKGIEEIKGILAKGKELAVEIKQYRKQRSLDSNSYCWVLIGKITDALNKERDKSKQKPYTPDEIYINMLKDYGQREPKLLSVVVDAVDMIYRATKNHCCEVGESELNGKLFKHLAILIGSSQYDSKSMAILIDGVVSEAKELGIETMTPNEIAELKSRWGEERRAG